MTKTKFYWYSLKNPKETFTLNLTGTKRTEVAIVGAGIAGLTTAYFLNQAGYKVILIEKEFCGAGASGKSSGFISPDSELQLTNFISKVGLTEAINLWEFSWSGVTIIRDIISKYSIDCHYMGQDAGLIATNWLGLRDIKKEYINRSSNNYKVSLYTNNIKDIIGSDKYYGGLIQPNCFSITSYLYCQELKNILLSKGVEIYENTPLIKIETKENSLITPNGKIKYDKTVLCLDKYLPEFNIIKQDIYQASTFLMISKPLTDNVINKIFPKNPLMVSDTSLVFNYYRMTPDNRLLLGGAPLFATYSSCPIKYINQAKNKLTKYFQNHFPEIVNVNNDFFEYIWGGQMGITKDLIPIIGQEHNLYYISGATGLSWASALAKYMSNKIDFNDTSLDKYFTHDRKYTISNSLQNIIGTKATFALNNFLSSYY